MSGCLGAFAQSRLSTFGPVADVRRRLPDCPLPASRRSLTPSRSTDSSFLDRPTSSKALSSLNLRFPDANTDYPRARRYHRQNLDKPIHQHRLTNRIRLNAAIQPVADPTISHPADGLSRWSSHGRTRFARFAVRARRMASPPTVPLSLDPVYCIH